MSFPNQPIYLDNHATTPVDPRVLQAMRPFWEAQFANPASAEHVMGRAVAGAVITNNVKTHMFARPIDFMRKVYLRAR